MDSSFEGRTFTNGVVSAVLMNGSCAIGNCEPCQVGDQAALSGCDDVPRECLSRADVKGTRMEGHFDSWVYDLI